MLKAYFCRLSAETPTVPEELLSSYRKEKLAAQNAPLLRRQSLFSELLLRYALRDCGYSSELPLEITVGEYGKPRLRDGEYCFSISHSAEMLLCALSDREIGADVQLRSKAKRELMERFFTAEELNYVLASEDADDALTEIWTKKESFCKLSGKGLALPLPSFSVLDAQISPLLEHRKIEGYHAAVCGEAVREGEIKWIEVKTDALL